MPRVNLRTDRILLMRVIFRNPVTYRTALCGIITAQSTFHRFPVVAFNLNNCEIATRFISKCYVLLWINTLKLDKLINTVGVRLPILFVMSVVLTEYILFYQNAPFLSNSCVLKELLIVPCVNICSSHFQLPVDLLRGQCLFNNFWWSMHLSRVTFEQYLKIIMFWLK